MNHFVPIYIVNLNDPPEKRWLHIIKDYKQKLQQLNKLLDQLISSFIPFGSSVILGMLSMLTKTGFVYYSQEITSIANYCNMDVGKLTAMQLIYEACACCTSIITNETKTGAPRLIGTMDWEMPFLKEQQNVETI